jgi:hypothetical protein
MLLEACKRPEISIHFEHKFVSWNREDKIATFQEYKKNFFRLKNPHFYFQLVHLVITLISALML